MARKRGRSIILTAVIALFLLLSLAYLIFSVSFSRSRQSPPISPITRIRPRNYKEGLNRSSECCRGVKGLELWGAAVKWGNKHKVESAEACCEACKEMCPEEGECMCNTWVFCGDKDQCGDKFGECWLKKQKDVSTPEIAASGDHVIWTSGIIYAKGQGLFGLETNHGTIRINMLPDCAPLSINYINDLLRLNLCDGCRFFRAEDRGRFWDYNGDHIPHEGFGPPYALIQGTLEAEGTYFKPIINEATPIIKRGSVAWVGAGPEFFISLANHNEWRNSHTVFGYVVPEDMQILEKIGGLSAKPDVWGNVTVLVLEDPVYFNVKRISLS